MRPRVLRLLLLAPLALLLLPAALASAAPGDQLWLGLVTAGAGKVVSPYWHEAIAVARSGDVYVAGTQATAESEDKDFLVARYGADGTHKWTKVYDHGKDEVVTDIAVDRDGNVVICGRENGYDGFLVVRLSRSGAFKWARRIKTEPGLSGAEEIAIDRFGRIYVVGTDKSDLCLAKYTRSGHRVWKRTYTKAEICSELALGPDGRLYVGMGMPEMQVDGKAIVACYTTAGDRVWRRAIGTPGDTSDWIMDLDVRRSGICGAGQSSLDGSTEGFVFRLRLDGTTKYWHHADGSDGAPSASFEGCGMDRLGRVSVTGWSGNDFVVRRFGSSGTMLDHSAWHGTQSNAMGNAIVVTDAGRVYATGRTKSVRSGEDMLTVGLGAAWEPLFLVPYRSLPDGDDEGGAIALGSGCVYVAGHSDGRLALIKYAR
jgi:outer membrane protein assembly factor BamB